MSVADLLEAGSPEVKTEDARIDADFLEAREALAGVGLSPKVLRQAIRLELGKRGHNPARPLHRSPELRRRFKEGMALASAGDGRLRPAHVLAAMADRGDDPAVNQALERLVLDPREVL